MKTPTVYILSFILALTIFFWKTVGTKFIVCQVQLHLYVVSLTIKY